MISGLYPTAEVAAGRVCDCLGCSSSLVVDVDPYPIHKLNLAVYLPISRTIYDHPIMIRSKSPKLFSTPVEF